MTKKYDLIHGNCLAELPKINDEAAKLIVTSPPYNMGKAYESRMTMQAYYDWQSKIITECVRILHPQGSICWQVGNYVKDNKVIPLDIFLYPIFVDLGLTLRNRIVWHFEHGLHGKIRFSGRHETILWFTKSSGSDYTFNLDPVRVPQKYPGKRHFKGPNIGELSGNPLGKNPGDVWIIPNVKNNHVEKEDHECQFPVGLVERLVLSLTNEGDVVLDPMAGVCSTAIAALKNDRHVICIDKVGWYIEQGQRRINWLERGILKTRPMNQEVYKPNAT